MTVLNPQSLVDSKKVISLKDPEGKLNSNQIQQVGIDLTVDKVYKIAEGSESSIGIEDRQIADYREIKPIKLHFRKRIEGSNQTQIVTMEEGWMLEPGYYLWDSNEKIHVPEDAMGIIFQRSTLLKSGTQIVSSIWDPGFHGTLGCHLIVHHPIKLERGARVGQVVFWKAEAASQYSGVYLGTDISAISGLSS